MSDKLPVVNFDVQNPDVNYGQIEKIYFAEIGNPLVTGDATEWNSRLSNDDVTQGSDSIRYFHVIGSKPAPEKPELLISLARTIYGTRKHTIPFKIDETDASNYDALRSFEDLEGSSWLFWYAAGKYIYGGLSGIEAQVSFDDIIPESMEELENFEGVVTWKGKTPERMDNPLI